METSKKRFSVVQLVQMSLLAALSYILMIFPTIPMFAFFKLDFGDIPILIGTMIFGPAGGILIAVIKSILYWITGGASIASLIGILASLTASIVILLSIELGQGWFKHRSRSLNIIGTVTIETISLVVVLSILNWLVITPLYANLIGFKIPNMAKYILIQVIPFNLIKGIVIGGIFMLVQGRLAKWINVHKK
ncbi:ECF transporter S component [Nicoliella spurrieriana]|uniref:Riboflavin transporter n=1 Tax=Nicoliella spurrieriana TaxID=2925830 RepID=A0A976RRQ0_9LACO|nr:ECF transporter S component [Nicoliella spurrieriana]UQS86559.1 ECF transporter S component [Nicoliella spurrieriana]